MLNIEEFNYGNIYLNIFLYLPQIIKTFIEDLNIKYFL